LIIEPGLGRAFLFVARRVASPDAARIVPAVFLLARFLLLIERRQNCEKFARCDLSEEFPRTVAMQPQEGGVTLANETRKTSCR
jgi:hypothetical protein